MPRSMEPFCAANNNAEPEKSSRRAGSPAQSENHAERRRREESEFLDSDTPLVSAIQKRYAQQTGIVKAEQHNQRTANQVDCCLMRTQQTADGTGKSSHQSE